MTLSRRGVAAWGRSWAAPTVGCISDASVAARPPFKLVAVPSCALSQLASGRLYPASNPHGVGGAHIHIAPILSSSTIKMVEAAPSRGNLCHLSSASRDDRLPPIHGLAIEVVAQILAYLDSGSLLTATRAHPLFYATFQTFQQHILKQILLRLIPLRLLPLAFATYEAASMDYSDWDLIRRLLDPVHVGQGQASSPSPGLPPSPLTHGVVAAMERVHLMVGYFTADFAQQAIPRFNRIFETTRPATSSPSEELRILRAFYRFQLYCNIFGRKAIDGARQANLTAQESGNLERERLPTKSPEDMSRELECFFWPWPAWANEQLACVFEYLETVVSVFFDDVASHDVEWGWRKVDWVEPGVAIPHRRFLVS